MSLQDDVARLTTVIVRMHQQTTHVSALNLRRSCGIELGQLAKAAGVTPEQVGEWEAGRATPSTGQALAWLDLLHSRAAWRATAGQEVSQ